MDALDGAFFATSSFQWAEVKKRGLCTGSSKADRPWCSSLAGGDLVQAQHREAGGRCLQEALQKTSIGNTQKFTRELDVTVGRLGNQRGRFFSGVLAYTVVAAEAPWLWRYRRLPQGRHSGLLAGFSGSLGTCPGTYLGMVCLRLASAASSRGRRGQDKGTKVGR